MPPSPDRECQKSTGAQFEIMPKTKYTRVYQTFSTLPHSLKATHRPKFQRVQQLTKKNIFLLQYYV